MNSLRSYKSLSDKEDGNLAHQMVDELQEKNVVSKEHVIPVVKTDAVRRGGE